MKNKIITFTTILVILSLIISGCVEENQEKEGHSSTESEMATTSILISDMPTDDFSHINVSFSEIKIHNNGTGWSSIQIENGTVDLIYLHLNDLNETLGIGELDPGNYTKLWIVVDSANGVLKSTNETVEFDVPSGTIKIQQLFKLEQGNNSIYLDIDLNNSILVTGNKYKILPVISQLRHKHDNKWKFTEGEVNVEQNGSKGKPIKVTVDENITFNATDNFDLEGENLSYVWDFGDGSNSTGELVVHSYSDKGSYWVVLTVTTDVEEFIKFIHVTVKKNSGKGKWGE